MNEPRIRGKPPERVFAASPTLRKQPSSSGLRLAKKPSLYKLKQSSPTTGTVDNTKIVRPSSASSAHSDTRSSISVSSASSANVTTRTLRKPAVIKQSTFTTPATTAATTPPAEMSPRDPAMVSPRYEPRVDSPRIDARIDASSRVERKVKDLEISNSSLLAVNKFLEKKLQQQAHQISMLRARSANTNTTDTINTNDGENYDEGDGEDDFFGEEDDVLDSDGEEESIQALIGGSVDNLDAIENRTKSHIDVVRSYQRINNSLTRCLYLTQSLITDANNSLQLAVSPDDIRIGGKVAYDDSFVESDGES
uniref:ARAD1A06622p n=1 Tax=Blastobotrys adeninivorans TaxID=409370 RepID=A0A060T343_BLAAD